MPGLIISCIIVALGPRYKVSGGRSFTRRSARVSRASFASVGLQLALRPHSFDWWATLLNLLTLLFYRNNQRHFIWPEFTSVPSTPQVGLALPLPKDGIESRYHCHFTRREGMHGVNLTLAGTKNRKPIRWKQRF